VGGTPEKSEHKHAEYLKRQGRREAKERERLERERVREEWLASMTPEKRAKYEFEERNRKMEGYIKRNGGHF